MGCRAMTLLCLALCMATLQQCGYWETEIGRGAQATVMALIIIAIIVTSIKYAKISRKPIVGTSEEGEDLKHLTLINLTLAVMACGASILVLVFMFVKEEPPDLSQPGGRIDLAYDVTLIVFFGFIAVYMGLTYGKTHSAISDHFLGAVCLMTGIQIIFIEAGEVLPEYGLGCDPRRIGRTFEESELPPPRSYVTEERHNRTRYDLVYEVSGAVAYAVGVEAMGLTWFCLLLWSRMEGHPVRHPAVGAVILDADRNVYTRMLEVTTIDRILSYVGTIVITGMLSVLLYVDITQVIDREPDIAAHTYVTILHFFKFVVMALYCCLLFVAMKFRPEDRKLVTESKEVLLLHWSTYGNVFSVMLSFSGALVIVSGAHLALLCAKYVANVCELLAQYAVIYNCLGLKRRLHKLEFTEEEEKKWKSKMRHLISPLLIFNIVYWAYDLWIWKSMLIIAKPSSRAVPSLFWVMFAIIFFAVCIYNRFHCFVSCLSIFSPEIPDVRSRWNEFMIRIRNGRERFVSCLSIFSPRIPDWIRSRWNKRRRRLTNEREQRPDQVVGLIGDQFVDDE